MKRLAYPMRFDGSIGDEYREHRRHHGWLRDLLVWGWLTFWVVAALFGLLLIGSVRQ